MQRLQTDAWRSAEKMQQLDWTCGHCGASVGYNHGYSNGAQPDARIYICPSCGRPTYFDPAGWRAPGEPYGVGVQHLPADLARIYDEARSTIKAAAPTGCALLCRVLLMYLCVDHGADAGRRFVEYVDFLVEEGLVPKKGKTWIDRVRTAGNKATHRTEVVTLEDAKLLVDFVGYVLRFNYEFPERLERDAKA